MRSRAKIKLIMIKVDWRGDRATSSIINNFNIRITPNQVYSEISDRFVINFIQDKHLIFIFRDVLKLDQRNDIETLRWIYNDSKRGKERKESVFSPLIFIFFAKLRTREVTLRQLFSTDSNGNCRINRTDVPEVHFWRSAQHNRVGIRFAVPYERKTIPNYRSKLSICTEESVDGRNADLQ